MTDALMRMFTVYDHPRDQPEHWVVREWQIVPGDEQAVLAVGSEYRCESLDLARKYILSINPGLVRMARSTDDDPVILETWL